MNRDEKIREALASLVSLVGPTPEASPLVASLMDRFCAHKRATNPKWLRSEYRVNPLRSFFGRLTVAEITISRWDEYAAKRMGAELGPVAPITLTQDQDLLRGIFNWSVDRGIITYNPLARVKRTRVKPNSQAPLREADLEPLIANAPNLLAAVFIVVGMDSGLRRAENISLQWPDINFEQAVIHVRCGKGDKPRDVATTTRALHFLRMLPRDRRTDFVYVNPRNGEQYCMRTANHWVTEAVEASGIEKRYGGKKIRIHALRHGHATNAIERGVDVRSVQEQLGHASLSITEKYLHARMDHRIAAMREKFEVGISLHGMPRKGPRQKTLLKKPLKNDVSAPVVKKASSAR